MLSKYGKFYADWEDAEGRRHRKAFATAKEARNHSAVMHEAAAADRKKQQASPQRRTKSPRGLRRNPTKTTTAKSSRKHSSRKRAVSHSHKSRHRTSTR